jgi:hypothetical protein
MIRRKSPSGQTVTSTYCLAHPGHEYLCFFPAGGAEGLDLHDAPGPFAAEWFNAATGDTIPTAEITGGRRQALSAPFPGPAVLYLLKPDQ